MDIPEAMICQNFYWPRVRKVFRKEVKNCDTCQRKNGHKKYNKLSGKSADEIPCNILCVGLIVPLQSV